MSTLLNQHLNTHKQQLSNVRRTRVSTAVQCAHLCVGQVASVQHAITPGWGALGHVADARLAADLRVCE
jgi:hypothetical protein